MRRLGVLGLLAATIGLATTAAESANQPDYTYSYPPSGYYYCPDSPEVITRQASAISQVLGNISSPARRDLLAEQWIQFSKQTITKSLAFRGEWLDLQKRQTQSQEEAQQLRVEVLRMEGEIEKMRAANLRLQNENLQLQMQLKQLAAGPTVAPAPQTQPTPGK